MAKLREPRFGWAGKFDRLAVPDKSDRPGMEGMVFQDQPGALLFCQASFDECEITILVAAVKFVADDGMAAVRKVDAKLVLASSARDEAQERKRE